MEHTGEMEQREMKQGERMLLMKRKEVEENVEQKRILKQDRKLREQRTLALERKELQEEVLEKERVREILQ